PVADAAAEIPARRGCRAHRHRERHGLLRAITQRHGRVRALSMVRRPAAAATVGALRSQSAIWRSLHRLHPMGLPLERRAAPDRIVWHGVQGADLQRSVFPFLRRSDAATGDLAQRRGGLQRPLRSEEHTSELQSLAYLVCRLLLEKKKTITS